MASLYKAVVFIYDVEPEFTLSELRVIFVEESLVRTKAGQTATHKVRLKL